MKSFSAILFASLAAVS